MFRSSSVWPVRNSSHVCSENSGTRPHSADTDSWGCPAYAVWLGKQVPVRSALETTVHSTLASRTGFQGVLAQVLSIGWGHSDVAIEMSRTKAGTNALLLIGALSAGPSYFAAAQTLSELLALSGCEADKLPTVDVLRPLIAYLAPFVRDLGFSKVLHHVTTSAEHVAMRKLNHSPASLTAAGEANVLAGAIAQLILTSRRGETAYFNTCQRGAWLAAFASHILGMSVDLVLDDTMLWASAGSSGQVTIQIGRQARVGTTTSLQYTGAPTNIILVDPPNTAEGSRPLVLDCTLAEALNASLGRHPLVDGKLRRAVQRAIANLSRDLTRNLRMKSGRDFLVPHNINGRFDSWGALIETLSHFGIKGETVQRSLDRIESWYNKKGWAGAPTETNGLEYLDDEGVRHLQQTCPTHQAGLGGRLGRCICCHIGGIIHGYASSVIALMQCRYDAEAIRVKSDLLGGTVTTGWVRGCVLESGESSLAMESRQLFSHLSQLLHSGDSDAPDETHIQSLKERMHLLGVSGGSTTIYYTLILTDDCYDGQGRLLTIASGRASINGVMRHLLVEANDEIPHMGHMRLGFDLGGVSGLPPTKTSEVVAGTYIQPHYRPSNLRVFMDATITEHEIRIGLALGDHVSQAKRIFLSKCIHNFLLTVIYRHCSHPHDEPWKTANSTAGPIRLSPFSLSATAREPGQLILYALKGRKLEQLIQCYIDECAVLQLLVCLGCASDLVGRQPGRQHLLFSASEGLCTALVMT